MDLVAPSGPVYQAGTLSGNPLAMAAGLATLRAAGQPGFYDRLEELGARWREGMGEAASAGSHPFTINQVGSMVSIFFTEGPVTDFGSAAASDTEAFKDFFWHMLSRGVYLAPSQYEAGFISTAHSEEDLDRTFEAAHEWFDRAGLVGGDGRAERRISRSRTRFSGPPRAFPGRTSAPGSWPRRSGTCSKGFDAHYDGGGATDDDILVGDNAYALAVETIARLDEPRFVAVASRMIRDGAGRIAAGGAVTVRDVDAPPRRPPRHHLRGGRREVGGED